MTQFLVDMNDAGIKVNPINQITGSPNQRGGIHHAFMPDDHVLGEIDGAWNRPRASSPTSALARTVLETITC